MNNEDNYHFYPNAFVPDSPVTGLPNIPNFNVPEIFGQATSYEDKLRILAHWIHWLREVVWRAARDARQAAESADAAAKYAKQLYDMMYKAIYGPGGILDRLVSAETRLTAIENRVLNLEGRVSTIEGEITDIYNKINTINGQITNLTNQYNALKKRIDEGDIGMVDQDWAQQFFNEYGSLYNPSDQWFKDLLNKYKDIVLNAIKEQGVPVYDSLYAPASPPAPGDTITLAHPITDYDSIQFNCHTVNSTNPTIVTIPRSQIVGKDFVALVLTNVTDAPPNNGNLIIVQSLVQIVNNGQLKLPPLGATMSNGAIAHQGSHYRPEDSSIHDEYQNAEVSYWPASEDDYVLIDSIYGETLTPKE